MNKISISELSLDEINNVSGALFTPGDAMVISTLCATGMACYAIYRNYSVVVTYFLGSGQVTVNATIPLKERNI